METFAAVALATATLVAPSSEAAQVSPAPSSFSWTAPAGYAKTDAVLSPPVEAMFAKRLHDGEAALIVERYSPEDAEGEPAAFARNLGAGARKSQRRIAGKSFEVYENIDVVTFTRQVQQGDPYAQSLGNVPPPPRLSLFESRRFPVGGEAYRLYRCRALGAWKNLRRYRRLRAKEGDIQAFRSGLAPVDRQVLSSCFGRAVLSAIFESAEVADVPKPSMYSLRIMARDEWQYGAERRIEREIVHLRPLPGGGLQVVRLRAPRQDFAAELPAFDAFLAALSPEPAP